MLRLGLISGLKPVGLITQETAPGGFPLCVACAPSKETIKKVIMYSKEYLNFRVNICTVCGWLVEKSTS
jgi:hypothetical protein